MGCLGLVLFGSIGGLYGRFEEPIKENISQRLMANPAILQASLGSGEAAAPTDQADPKAQSDPKAQADAVAETAWGRLKFFHGHGFSMVLASFVAFLLIANARLLSNRSKAILTWLGLVTMSLYNIGWFLAGGLVGFLSLDHALKVGEFGFFIPFGTVTVALWLIVLIAWIREGRSPEDIPDSFDKASDHPASLAPPPLTGG